MTISNESRDFFKSLSRVWQNYKDYTYLEGIKLSEEQISIIEHDEDQLLIEGYAGTGKSLTLLYKFINVLVREEGKRILFVTFNDTLISDTRKRLASSKEYMENRDRHDAHIATFHEIASQILKKKMIIDKGVGRLTAKKVEQYRDISLRRIAAIAAKYTRPEEEEYKKLPREERLYSTHEHNFITDEIAWIKAMGFIEKEKYLETERTGRSKSIRLTRAQRKTIFKIYEEYKELLKKRFHNHLDLEDYALSIIENSFLLDDVKFDYIFVDEVQDLDPMQIKALCMLTKKSIILSGDAKQRIYKKSPIKYEDLGLKIREKGKRKTLNKNYRSTAEIVRLANSLQFLDDEDKLIEKLFVRSGERPFIYRNADLKRSVKYVVDVINKVHGEDPFKTVAIIHREEIKETTGYKSNTRIELEVQLKNSVIDIEAYGKKFEQKQKRQVVYTNAYDVKGLEFDVVFILDFRTLYYPNKKEIDQIKLDNDGKDPALIDQDISEFVNREKKLLYVAMTRAKDKLYLVANGCKEDKFISKFICDFEPSLYEGNFAKKQFWTHPISKVEVVKSTVVKNKEIDIQQSLEKTIDLSSNISLKEVGKEETLNGKDKDGNLNNILREKDTFTNNEIELEAKLKEKTISINEEKIKNDITKGPSTVGASFSERKVDNHLVGNDIVKMLKEKKLEVIDKRAKGGALWVIGGNELKDFLKKLPTGGGSFVFASKGGKASKHRPAWYLKK